MSYERVTQQIGKSDGFTSFLVIAVGVIVLMTNALVPTLVGVYVDHFGLSISESGYTAAIYMTGGGVGAALVSFLLLPVRTPILLAIGLAALALANFASIFAHSLTTILALRLIAGIGEGMGLALMGAAVSRMKNPNRAYGIFVVAVLLMSAAAQYSIPWLRGALGAQMLFVPIAVVPACLLLVFWKFPNLAGTRKAAAPVARSAAGRSTGLYFWSGILATLVVYIAYGGGFAYMERIGVHTGLGADTVATMLGTGYLISAGAALLSILTANVWGTTWKLSISLVVVACSTLLAVSGEPEAYRIGMTGLFFAWFYFVPNLLGLMSLADPTGRLAAAVTGAMECGLALGPAIAAFWVSDGSFTAVGTMAVGGFSIAMVLLIPVLRHVRELRTVPGSLNERHVRDAS
ncbi:MAG: MFS transporter [Gammaproteobacteria bacterium]